MATRFTYQFVTARDETFRVDIDDADHVGSSTEIDAGPEGFALRYDGDVDKVVPGIVGSSVNIPIIVTADNQSVINTFADDVRTSAETRFTVAIYQTIGITTTLYWCGYVLKDLSGFEDRGDVYTFSIKAADGLARMKFVDYADSGAPYGSLKFITHLINCLTEVGNTSYWGGSDVWLRTVVNWSEGGMPSVAAANDPLNYSRVSGEVFTERRNTTDDQGWKFDSVYKVLQELCTAWGARLMLSDGAWRFEQVRERMEENFYERRYSTAGTLLSSTNAAGYDKPILQIGSAHRLTGGAFNYLPALQKVEVEYKHNTYVNQIGGQSYRWQKDSTYSNQTYTVSGISFDSDSFFRVSGYVTLDVSTTYSMPWRVVFGILLRLPDNPYRLRSLTTAVQVVPTAPIYKINREPVTWTATDSGLFYEISTNVITSGKFKGAIPFSFQTPVVPAGQKSFSINFASLIRGEYADGSPATLTFTDWKFHDTVLTINGLDTAANFEEERLYKSSNTVTGNSDALIIKPAFGHAVKAWTPTKIEVTNNGTDWTNSTATWDRGTDTNNDEFGELLARQLMSLQQQPVETYSGTLKAAAIKAHSRITLPDSSTWLMNRAEFFAKPSEWRVEMLKTGIANGADIVSDTPIAYPGPETDPFNPFGLVSAPTDGTGSTTAQSLDGPGGVKNIANTVSTNVPTGTVTSIPVDLPVKGGTIKDNDVIIVYDPQTDTTHVFTVDGDVPNGNTTITVDSTSTTVDIPAGAQVFYPDINFFTTSTGGGGFGGGGTGDILDGGNTTGATVVIGTNDANALALETNNVTRMQITGGASTGGQVTITNVTANTNTAQDVVILQSNSTGTAAAGFGNAILFQGESSTTDNRDMARIGAIWTTATDASREAKLSIQLGDNGSALAEIANFNVSGNDAGQLSIGSSTPVTIQNNSLTTGTNFTLGNSSNIITVGGSTGQAILGGSSGAATVSSSGSVGVTIHSTHNTATTTTGIVFGNGTSFTQTSGTRNYINYNWGFAPTSGTAVHNQLAFTGTFNQTGGANGITRGIFLNQTITAVADFRALEIAANGSNVKGLYQSGTTAVNNFAGSTAFGTTSAPDASAIVDIVSTSKGLGLPSMTTAQVNAISAPRDGLTVYDTDTDTVKVRANGAWVSLGTGSGTITGSGTSGRVAYFDGTSSIASDTLYWDATNNRLGVNKSSPAVTLDIQTANASDGIRLQSDGTAGQSVWGFEMVGTGSAGHVQRARWGMNTSSSAQGQGVILNLITDGFSNNQPFGVGRDQMTLGFDGTYAIQGTGTGNRIRIETAGGVFSVTNWLLTNSSYTTNDTTARLKLVGIGTTSSNSGLRIHDGSNNLYFIARDDQRIGIVTASPAVSLDVSGATDSIALPGGTTAQRPAVNNSVRYNSTVGGFEGRHGGVWYRLTSNLTPTIAAGVAAGTSPGTPTVFGNDLGGQISITTGTACTTGTLVTVTFNQALDAGAVITVMLTPRNATTAAQYGRFYVGSSGNVSFVITAATAPDDATEYVFNYSINQ